MRAEPDTGPADVEETPGRSSNVTRVRSTVTREERHARAGHTGLVLWFTGLSGSGKSTVGQYLERRLFDGEREVVLLDGDTLRHGLNGDLSFSTDDRTENIRRTAEVAALLARLGKVVIVALISPTSEDRDRARRIVRPGFCEVFIDADIGPCEARDPKGLYARARTGEIANFTGISAPYEAPGRPDVVIDTAQQTVDQSVDNLLAFVDERLSRLG